MSAPGKILILTSGSLSRNPRPAKEAATLAQAGYEVIVLHPGEGPPYDSLDSEMAAAAGFRNELVGAGARGGRRLRRWLAQRAVPFGFESAAALGADRALLARAGAFASDLTIVHNEISLWVGAKLLERGRRVAADIEDWYSEDLQIRDRRHRPLRLLRSLESLMLRKAAYVSTTSEALAAALLNRYGGRQPVVITNSFPLQPDPRTSRPRGEGPPAFFWFSQTIGPGRGLEAFLQTWRELATPSRLVLLGAPRPGFPDQLRSLLPPALRPKLEFHGLVPPAQLASVIARHDLGLALEESSIASRDCTITNKILQYLNAGLAVVVTSTAGQREVLRAAPQAGLLFDSGNPARAAAALDPWLSDPLRLRQAQLAARAAAEKTYNWEREAPKLLHWVNQALSAD